MEDEGKEGRTLRPASSQVVLLYELEFFSFAFLRQDNRQIQSPSPTPHKIAKCRLSVYSKGRWATMAWPYPQYGWDFLEEIPETSGKTPETLSEFFWNFPREYGWDAPSPIIQGRLKPPEHLQNSLPLSTTAVLLFQNWFRRGPLRAGHGIPSSAERACLRRPDFLNFEVWASTSVFTDKLTKATGVILGGGRLGLQTCRRQAYHWGRDHYILDSEKTKSCKRKGVALQQLIPTQRREKNCNCNRKIRGFQGRTAPILTLH